MAASRPGDDARLSITLRGGDKPLTALQIHLLEADGGTAGQMSVATLLPGEERTVEVSLPAAREVGARDLAVEIRYRQDGLWQVERLHVPGLVVSPTAVADWSARR